MKDEGLNKGLVQHFDTSNRRSKGVFYGFRKMFWKYLTKLNVAFYDPCCDDASVADTAPVRWNVTDEVLEFFDKETGEWTATA